MSNKILQAAVAVALGTVASTALAFDPTTSIPDYKFVMAGATASTTTVREFTIEDICDSSETIDVFRRSASGNDWAVACKTKATLDATHAINAKHVLFIKRDAGGSGLGVTPVLNNLQIGIMKIETGTSGQNCGDFATYTSETTPAPSSVPFHQHLCGNTDEPYYPDGGFSDIEPSKFYGPNRPSGNLWNGNPLPDYSTPTVPGYDVRTTAGLIFNTPVNLNLRNALQVVQFPAGSVCNPGNADYLTDPDGAGPLPKNSESYACMPSLTTTEIRSLFAGGIGKWDSFLVNNGGATRVSLASAVTTAGFGSLVPADAKVEICRRVPGSGTQSQFNAIFMNRPCDSGSVDTVLEPGNALQGPVVANNSGAGDVEKCLVDFNNGTNTSGKNGGGAHRWAIGVQSTEFNVGATLDYRFIKINNYAPTLQDVHAGDYEDYAESSMQWRTDVPNVPAAYKADAVKIFDYIATSAVNPTVLANLNGSYKHTWGEAGWLAIPKTTVSPSNPFSSSNPVNSSTRSYNHGPNTCQPPVAIKPVQVDTNLYH